MTSSSFLDGVRRQTGASRPLRPRAVTGADAPSASGKGAKPPPPRPVLCPGAFIIAQRPALSLIHIYLRGIYKSVETLDVSGGYRVLIACNG